MVIGHEMHHAFDDEGVQYDKNGNLNNWWSDKTFNNYKDRKQCLIDQYSNYSINGLSLNGSKTQGDDIADNGLSLLLLLQNNL